MQKFRFTLFSAVLLVAARVIAPAQAPVLHFEQLSSEIGLTHSTINCFLQDHKGYLWFGTWSGLGRYDGFGVHLFRQESGNPRALSSDQITSIIEDRSHRIWIGTLNSGIFRYDHTTEQFTNFRFLPDQPNSLSDNDVWSLYEDSRGYIWIGTKKGLNRFDPATGNFLRVYAPEGSGQGPTSNYIYCIVETSDGSIWSATTRGLLRIRFKDTRNYLQWHYFIHEAQDQVDSTLGNFVYKVRPALREDRTLWVGTKAGLKKIRFGKPEEGIRVLESFRAEAGKPGSLSNNVVSDFLEEADGSLWVATFNGLNRFFPEKRVSTRFFTDPEVPYTLSNNKIIQLYKDRSGILWIGTNKGINKLNLNKKPFYNFKAFSSGPVPTHSVTHLSQGEGKNEFWIGAQGGLTRMRLSEGRWETTQYALLSPRLTDFSNFISAVFSDRQGNLWVSSQGAGVFFIDKKDIPPNGGYIRRMEQFTRGRLNDDYVMAMFETGDNLLWLGLWDGGIDLLERNTGTIHHFPSVGGINLSAFPNVAFTQTTDGNGRINLWVGTRGNGLLKLYFDETDKNLHLEQQFRFNAKEPGTLSNDKVNALFVDSRNRLWASTSSGLNVLSPARKSFKSYSVKDGLPDLAVQSALEDGKGNIWISTQNGIAKMEEAGGKVKMRSFDVLDGLQDNFFNNNCALRLPSGLLAFGGVDGLTLFDPAAIAIDTTPPQAAITDFRLFNKSVLPGSAEYGRQILEKPLSETGEIVLNYKENVLSFEFVGLHFAEPRKNRFAYILEGFDDDWTYTDANKRYVHYTNLPYRSYVFKVKAANSDGIWGNPVSIGLRVKPPFWLTYWAFVLYGLIFAGLLYAMWWVAHLRAGFRNRLMLEQLEREKIEEVSRVKLQFFTNISHELRTPLALIISPLEQLLREAPSGGPIHKTYSLMHRNAEKLLGIINQLLDFRKSEAGLMNIRAERTNLFFFLREIVGGFLDFAREHQIEMRLETDNEEVYAWVDRDQMEKVMGNLLSNAIKFTANGGRVIVGIEEDIAADKVSLWVSNKGPGIPEDQLDRVFDPFFQGENKPRQEHFGGTGIGLALVRAIIDRHRGSVSVESKQGEMTTFRLHLQGGFAHFDPSELVNRGSDFAAEALPAVPSLQELPEESESRPARPHLLLVEDNADIRGYLKENLQQEYEISEAGDGLEALQKAREIFPDLILSDIAMPKMDGIEFCRQIKSDILTCHIPVILLTARTSLGYHIEGLEGGGDDYISKPFNMQVLQLRIRNLIRMREQLREKFSQSRDIAPAAVVANALDESFLSRILEIVEENMDECAFSIDDLARRMAMSRMQLYRKIKALTGQTPNTLIRTIRLKRAAQLLETKQFNISEVAYKVGFSDLKYFRERFKEHFGATPSEYMPRSRQM